MDQFEIETGEKNSRRGLAYNRNMKRLALSVLGGVTIPFLYAVTIGPLTPYIQNQGLKELAGYPVRWPIIVLTRFLPLNSFPFRDGDEIFVLLLVMLSDVLLYSSVTYVLLWRFWKRKTQPAELPPEPPQFVQH